MMQSAPQLAYCLSQAEGGWIWRIYNEDGHIVASGEHVDRQAAQSAVNARLNSQH